VEEAVLASGPGPAALLRVGGRSSSHRSVMVRYDGLDF
jgi:hypothetical protein